MKKCLVWGTGSVFQKYCNVLKYYELNNEIIIIGVTSGDAYYNCLCGYKFIDKSLINIDSFDYIIIAADSNTAREICQEVETLGVDNSRAIPINAILLPEFDFEKYEKIRENTPTIISPNCWGGLSYSALGLEFKSPFINMFLNHDDYLKALSDLDYYMECPLEFLEMRNDLGTHEYPVVKCGDVTLFFNHYYSFNEVDETWNKRKNRMNMNNSLVMFFDEDRNRVETFLKLPFKRKVCFAPFESDNPDVISIDYKQYAPDKPFWKIVNDSAYGGLYNVFELFLNNKKQIIAGLK